MREIKFKAWDKVVSKWNLSVEIDCFGSIQEYKWNGSSYNAKYQNDRFELVQYLGIKDLNDTEVYEGDIINFGENCYGAIHYNEGEWKYTFYSQGEKASNDLSLSDWIEDGVLTKPVVGNIYENQNLLQ